MTMRRFFFSAVLALSAACGGDDSNVTYPPFPLPTKGPDAGPSPDGGSPAAAPVINELYYGEALGDPPASQYVEIYGAPNTDYSSYSLVWLRSNSNTGKTGDVMAVVDTGTTNADGIFSITADAAGITNGIDHLSQSWLLVEGNTAAVDDDLDTDDDGVLDVTPWTAVVDAVAIEDGSMDKDAFYVAAGGTTYGVVLDRSIDGVATTDGGGVARIPDGTDTDAIADWKYIPPTGVAADATQANSTPGATNTTGT